MKSNITILIGSIAISVFLLELTVRWWLPISNVRYYYNAEIGTTLAPNSRMRWISEGDFDNVVETNSIGFHDSEHSWNKNDGNEYRIIVLGDSYLEGLQVPIGNLFSQRLQKTLIGEYSANGISVINLGLSGRGPSQHYRILDTIGRRLQPDLVVLAVTVSNDFRDSSPAFNPALYKPIYEITADGAIALTRFEVPSTFSIQGMLQRSATAYAIVHLSSRFNFLNETLIRIGLLPRTTPAVRYAHDSLETEVPFDQQIYLKDPPVKWKEAKRITFRMISEIIDLADELGAPTLIFGIPTDKIIEVSEEELDGPSDPKSVDWALPYRELRELLTSENASYVDLVPAFRERFHLHGERLRWKNDGHWNDRGHEIAAQVVARGIVQAGYLNEW